ncbi:MAG: hypothetical protein QOH07_3083 [Mycobacterium sp.]|nr:hypothetical protein [Mycobacterium sp.]
MAQTNSVCEVAAIPDRNQTVIDLRCVCRPHLLPPAHPQRRFEERSIAQRNRRTAPLSSELWHCTAYPENPEATWAQPLSREELS